jgi:hypothetical protein
MITKKKVIHWLAKMFAKQDKADALHKLAFKRPPSLRIPRPRNSQKSFSE